MIHFVIGTRAQLFKMTPIMLECEARGLEWRWIYAAQHRDTFDETVKFFGLPAASYTVVDWDTEAKSMARILYWLWKMTLGLVKSRKTLDGYTGKEHIVLTHGDTITTVYGALMGKLTRTKVMHVESGLRSYNILKPFPEEINRLITFNLSDYYACPGDWAVANLKKYKGVKINTKENTQKDVLGYGLKNIDKATLKTPKSKYVVLSTHRFENVYDRDRFSKILEIAEYAAKKYKVIMPQHPVTVGQIDKHGFRERLESNPNFILKPRLEYENFLKAIVGSEFVMADGGGNQEELYHLGKPTLILRNETERKEGLGTTAVVSKLDVNIAKDFIDNYQDYQHPPIKNKVHPSKIIVDSIKKFGQ